MDTATLVSRLTKAHYAFLGRWPGFERADAAGLVLIANRQIPAGYRNHAARIVASVDDIDTLLRQATDWLAARGRPLVVQLDPATQPYDMAERLVQRGLRLTMREAWMVYDGLVVAHSGAPQPTAEARSSALQPAVGIIRSVQHDSPLAIRTFEADDEAAVQAYVDCFNVCFGMTPEVGLRWGQSFRGSLTDPRVVHYLGEYAAEPASAMSLYYADELGCVYNVGTFPQFRGRGRGGGAVGAAPGGRRGAWGQHGVSPNSALRKGATVV